MSFSDEEGQQNIQVRRIALVIVIVLVLAGGAWWWLHRPPVPPPPEPVAPIPETPAPPPPAADSTAIQHPLEPAAPSAADTAPSVDPDALAGTVLNDVFAGKLADWLIPDKLVRRMVATLDNLPRNVRIEPLRPLRPPSKPFAVQRESLDAAAGTERITIAPANAARYDIIVGLLADVDAAKAVEGYRRLYPQLQKAYEDLGYPGRYFNDRVVEVIDHLLAAPEPAGPLLLEQPKVMYRFADPDLESRSAGQKILLRMGLEHERVVKDKLRAIRALIVGKE
jgi:Protein of unknown function (DUF3014)